jgi:AraC-like DNA-binding protein
MSEAALFTLPALRRARDLIDRDYAEPLDLDAMARTAGYSKYHFARSFAAAYGETPAAYLTRRRIERAKTLLRGANLNVTEVCYMVGFASLGTFSRRFSELASLSPSAYRAEASPWLGCGEDDQPFQHLRIVRGHRVADDASRVVTHVDVALKAEVLDERPAVLGPLPGAVLPKVGGFEDRL